MHALTERRLLARVARAQRDGRLPSLSAGVLHDGALWCAGRGAVDGAAPTADTQYRIGSITKPFTAVLVLQLRDEGLLDLDDLVADHVDVDGPGQRTIGQLLSHSAGLQAETDGDWWERSAGRSWEDLGPAVARPAPRERAGGAFHYSNLGYAVLGRIVERHRRMPWAEALARRILAPLELRRTTCAPQAPAAPGLAVHPWADVVLPEPASDTAAMAPAGQLWSTTGDLARWARFLLGDTGEVLAEATLEEMAQPRAVADAAAPGAAYGLGLMSMRDGGRTLLGHGGSIPGFVAGLWVDRDEQTAAVALANSTVGLDGSLPADLLALVAAHEPRIADGWAPQEEEAPAVLDLVGVWYWGPHPMGLRACADGTLELGPLGEVGRRTRLSPVAADRYLGRDGYFAGEVLRVERAGDGRPQRLDLASFSLTREPYAPAEAIPGGVDPGGWRGR